MFQHKVSSWRQEHKKAFQERCKRMRRFLELKRRHFAKVKTLQGKLEKWANLSPAFFAMKLQDTIRSSPKVFRGTNATVVARAYLEALDMGYIAEAIQIAGLIINRGTKNHSNVQVRTFIQHVSKNIPYDVSNKDVAKTAMVMLSSMGYKINPRYIVALAAICNSRVGGRASEEGQPSITDEVTSIALRAVQEKKNRARIAGRRPQSPFVRPASA